MACGTTAAAVVWEVAQAGVVARRFVEVNANKGWSVGLSAGILLGTVIWLVVQARTHRTVWLSKKGEGDDPKFKVNGLPGYA